MKKVWKIIFLMIVIFFVSILFYFAINMKDNRVVNGKIIKRTVARQKNEQNFTEVTSLDGKKVPVPTGYVASGVESERKVCDGFVIYEGTETVNESNLEEAQKTRNQWVWVPVNDPDRIYSESNGVKNGKIYEYNAWFNPSERKLSNDYSEPSLINSSYLMYGLKNIDSYRFFQEMQIEFDETIESIKTYGGFYIGRYETGDLRNKVSVVKKMNFDISNQNWYKMYGSQKYLSANKSVGTNMMWCSLWQETIQWFVESGKKTSSELINSGNWGNFKTSTFNYKNTNGSDATKTANTVKKIPTGSAEVTKVNNIYDMAGNVSEACMGQYKNSFSYDMSQIGGGASDNSQVVYINSLNITHYNNSYYDYVGTRACLYIK